MFLHLRFHGKQPDNHIPNQLLIYSFQTVRIQQYHLVVEYLKLALGFVVNMPYRWNRNTCTGKIPANLKSVIKIRQFRGLKFNEKFEYIRWYGYTNGKHPQNMACTEKEKYFYGKFMKNGIEVLVSEILQYASHDNQACTHDENTYPWSAVFSRTKGSEYWWRKNWKILMKPIYFLIKNTIFLRWAPDLEYDFDLRISWNP